MHSKKLWIIVIVLFTFLIAITIFAALNPNKPVTHILESFMTEQKINEFNTICSKCGIHVKNISRDDSLDGLDGENTIGFRIEMQYRGSIILYIREGSVKSIRFADNYLYNDENFISNISKYLK